MAKSDAEKAAAKAAKEAEKAAATPEALAAKPELEASLQAPVPAAAPAAPADLDGITVGNPEALRPKELPLVITPDNGSWKNDAQAEYAAYLNAYAYKNAKKWEKKKAALLKRLVEIGNDPEAIVKYRGNVGRVTFKNELFGG